jgi:Protein of unknown function (DUF2829)
MVSTGLNFVDALHALRQGDRVQREHWRVGEYIYLHEGGSEPHRFVEPSLFFRNAGGSHEPGWRPSALDLLATDWEYVK